MSGKEGVVESFPSSRPREPAKPPKWYHLFGKDISHVSVDAGYDTSSETSSLDESTVRPDHNVFEAPEATEIYKLVEGYEGTHRFDPSATWPAEEEKKLVGRVRFEKPNLHPPTSY